MPVFLGLPKDRIMHCTPVSVPLSVSSTPPTSVRNHALARRGPTARAVTLMQLRQSVVEKRVRAAGGTDRACDSRSTAGHTMRHSWTVPRREVRIRSPKVRNVSRLRNVIYSSTPNRKDRHGACHVIRYATVPSLSHIDNMSSKRPRRNLLFSH